ncbi:thiamine biosynthesis lipoprotein [Palleronia salina]|uniref:FAD:protein FMN transferase n=1 Tax=Palleronia salina TaxID=313368 RepID=A0A1M6BPN4_9RHOB|nr:FAD:protein FMN transferase [Palleronia salina]SHI50503.1 thiamine biosynthesis lipoprotein [Palleronia salina]
MRRRRFLALSAAALAAPAATPAWPETRWRGFGLGAELSMTLRAPPALARDAIAAAREEIETVERAFSLYRDDSELVRLNTSGILRPSPLFTELAHHVDRAHALTGGVFDPTVQAVWAALAQGRDPAPARAAVGWHRVHRAPGTVALQRGQSLTFNGIAQGFATDRVRARLAALGLGEILVNMGEFAALGGPWQLGIADPAAGLVARTTLTGGAIATTSAAPHLIAPDGRASRHATVSVEAPDATLADALSTAALFMAPGELSGLLEGAGATAIHTVDANGRHRRI